VRRWSAAGGGILLLATVALAGPRARVDGAVRPVSVPRDVDAWLHASEDSVPDLRPGDEKAVVWAGPRGAATDVAVVYLHGFSADRHEIDPVPEEVARALGANLFFTRLTGHGRDGPAMGEATADDWLQDTEEAMAVGRRIGRRVVLIGTSTGGTLATWVAAQGRWRQDLVAVVLVSPNYGVRDRRARILLWPWGGLLARLLVGGERCFTPANAAQARHWTTCYPTRVLPQMMALVAYVRALDPGRIRTPLLSLYSPDDQVVDPGETERLFARFASTRKRIEAVEGSSDGDHHVLAGDILSPAYTARVLGLVLDFLAPLAPPRADTP
jgi:esterase/lipase